MGGWRALFALLNRLAAWLGRWLRARRAAKRQRARERLEADPRGWYRAHFGGVRDDDAEQATDADQTESDDPDQPGQ